MVRKIQRFKSYDIYYKGMTKPKVMQVKRTGKIRKELNSNNANELLVEAIWELTDEIKKVRQHG